MRFKSGKPSGVVRATKFPVALVAKLLIESRAFLSRGVTNIGFVLHYTGGVT